MFSGHWELLLIILLVLLVFGAKRIPSMMENMAKGIQSFKRGLKDDDQRIGESDDQKK